MSPGQGLRPGRGLFLFQFIVLEEKLDISFYIFTSSVSAPHTWKKEHKKH
tara:strand:- start:391 stop:540 length:150 start_codon:yes stop_codon:yes gene_type:complete